MAPYFWQVDLVLEVSSGGWWRGCLGFGPWAPWSEPGEGGRLVAWWLERVMLGEGFSFFGMIGTNSRLLIGICVRQSNPTWSGLNQVTEV